jgi:hypothetical protein
MQGLSHKGIKVDLEDLETLINQILANCYDDDYHQQQQQQHGDGLQLLSWKHIFSITIEVGN